MARVERHAPLPDDRRSRLLIELGRLLGAGLDPLRALNSIEGDRELELRVEACRRALEQGRPFAAAASGAGFLSTFEATAVRIGESAGAMDATLSALGERARASVERWNRLRARSAMPAAVLALGVAVGPLPDVAAGRTTALDYALTTALVWALIGVVWSSLGSARVRRAAGPALRPFRALLVALPIGRSVMSAALRAELLGALGLLYAAGMPVNEAISALRKTVSGSHGPRALRTLASALQRGLGVADALREAKLLDSLDHSLLDSAESAGRLQGALEQTTAKYEHVLDDAADLTAEWAPRIAYAAVMLFLAGRWLF